MRVDGAWEVCLIQDKLSDYHGVEVCDRVSLPDCVKYTDRDDRTYHIGHTTPAMIPRHHRSRVRITFLVVVL